jgi:predicted GIY-YIG superfamily endonuclease
VEHNSPRAHWTKQFQPWDLVHSEKFDSRGKAVMRERQLKALKGIARYLAEIQRGEK